MAAFQEAVLKRFRSLCAAAVLLATTPGASNAAEKKASEKPPDGSVAKLYEGLEFRNIGPFRGGRVDAVVGVRGQPLAVLRDRDRVRDRFGHHEALSREANRGREDRFPGESSRRAMGAPSPGSRGMMLRTLAAEIALLELNAAQQNLIDAERRADGADGGRYSGLLRLPDLHAEIPRQHEWVRQGDGVADHDSGADRDAGGGG